MSVEPSPARGKPKILVVDDDLFIRRPLELMLAQNGFDAITAANGAECLEKISAEQPDLIVLDVMMPDRNGFELCRAIKAEARYEAIPIILLSARVRDHDRERGLLSGAADYLTKPYSSTDLLGRIRNILSPDRAGGADGK